MSLIITQLSRKLCRNKELYYHYTHNSQNRLHTHVFDGNIPHYFYFIHRYIISMISSRTTNFISCLCTGGSHYMYTHHANKLQKVAHTFKNDNTIKESSIHCSHCSYSVFITCTHSHSVCELKLCSCIVCSTCYLSTI